MLSQEQLAHVTSYSGLVAGAGPSLGPLGQVRAPAPGNGHPTVWAKNSDAC